MGGVIIVLHLLNATAVFGASFTLYFFGMVTTIAMGCFQFSEILILRPGSNREKGAGLQALAADTQQFTPTGSWYRSLEAGAVPQR